MEGSLIPEAGRTKDADQSLEDRHRGRAEDGPPPDEQDEALVPMEEVSYPSRRADQGLIPCHSRVGQRDLAGDRVEGEGDQLVLVADMAVHGGRPRAELGAQPAHAECVRAFGVDDADGRRHDCVSIERRPSSARAGFG